MFEDITQLEGGSSEIDRELAQLSQGAQVDDELAKMKAELGLRFELDAPALEEEVKEGVIVRISGEGSSSFPTRTPTG